MQGNGRALSWLLSLMATGAAMLTAQPFPRQDIPPELRPWVSWVLDEAKDHLCTTVEANAVCLWPGRLRLDLATVGGSFRQELLADRNIDAALPGDEKHWPQGVTLDGRPAPVFAQEGGADDPRLGGIARGGRPIPRRNTSAKRRPECGRSC